MKEEKRRTQTEIILEYMRGHNNSISTLEGFTECDCVRLGAKVNEMRKDGYTILTELKTRKNKSGRKVRYAVYHLVE